MPLDLQMVSSFLQVVMIDLVLAGDNAIVIGLAAAGVAPHLRPKAIMIGIAVATVMRIGFALIASRLLAFTGLLLAGGLLLLWVAWKMYCELRGARRAEQASAEIRQPPRNPRHAAQEPARRGGADHRRRRLYVARQRAGGGRGGANHPTALVFGLILSVALMGVASAWIAKLLERHHWIAWAGLLVILYVALRMVYAGADEVLAHGCRGRRWSVSQIGPGRQVDANRLQSRKRYFPQPGRNEGRGGSAAFHSDSG